MSPHSSSFKDHFSSHAADYREFRPAYPPELFAFLASVSPAHDLVWDCGTGNGQAAVRIAPHFKHVFATDASDRQLQEAELCVNVEYAVAPAERCPLPDFVVDLVLITQALHWFDHDRFYAEVRRICKPGGIIAATCYYAPSVNANVDPVIRRWEDFIRPYWTPERVWVDAGYRTIPFPFPEMPVPRFELKLDSDLRGFRGYLGTWSATKQYIKAHSVDPLDGFKSDFAQAWGDAATVRTVRWEFNVRLGRVN